MVESGGNTARAIGEAALPILMSRTIMLACLRQKRLRMCPKKARPGALVNVTNAESPKVKRRPAIAKTASLELLQVAVVSVS
jgi:hypothetical protein